MPKNTQKIIVIPAIFIFFYKNLSPPYSNIDKNTIKSMLSALWTHFILNSQFINQYTIIA